MINRVWHEMMSRLSTEWPEQGLRMRLRATARQGARGEGEAITRAADEGAGGYRTAER